LGITAFPRLLDGEYLLMGEEPVPSARDLQRYNGLLLEKQRELSSVQGGAGARVPAAGGFECDLIDRSSRSAYTRRTVLSCEQ
jgi:hypothetical protein